LAVLNPDHLFDQAEKLTAPPPAGPPRQVDLRRAISAAYYGVFHYVVRAAADEVVGITQRASPRYTLVYRSADYRALRDLCTEAKKQQLSARYHRYAPQNGFGANVQAFATAVVELQEKRHSADYDPSVRVRTSDARLAIATARSAVRRFENAPATQRKSFLTLLLFPPR
jgi:uncharacterized protein (UPF0332 family)